VIFMKIPSSNNTVDLSPGWHAARALVAIGPASVPSLIHALQMASPFAQENAATALFKLRGAEAAPLFRAVLLQQLSVGKAEALDGRRVELRRTLVRGLTDMKDREAIPLLVACLRQDHDYSVRAVAAESLAKLDAHSAVPALREAARDRDRTVRNAAYTALKKLAGPSALASELSTRTDTEAVLEFCAAADKSSFPALIALLRHREFVVRVSAVDALRRLRDPDCIPVLLERLSGADDEDRVVLCGTLGEFRDARTTPSLLVLLGASNAKVRRAAAFALGWPRNHEAWEPLARLALRDRDSQVRQAALYAVGRLDTRYEHAAALFDALLADPDPKVRQEAKLQLALLPKQARATRP
jgi:HEAT repeat protein